MALQVEDVDYAFPRGLALPFLSHGHGFGQRGLPAVLAFNGSLELVDAHI